MGSMFYHNQNAFLALLLAFGGGILAGMLTAFIHNKLKILILAGILTMTMLYSINIRILGNKSNLPLLNSQSILTKVANFFHLCRLIWPIYYFLLFLLF